MKYPVKKVPISHLIIGQKGPLRPLCNECKSKDCENPIEMQEVSVYGVIEKMRCWTGGPNISIVVNCSGYLV